MRAPWPRLLQPHGERERLAVPGWDIPVHDVPHLIGVRPHGRPVTYVGQLCQVHGIRGPHHGEGVCRHAP